MKRRASICILAILGAGFALMRDAAAVTTQVFRDDSFAVLQGGELEDVALTSDGFIAPTHARRPLGDTGTEIVWNAVRLGKDEVLCATGHEGKLVRVKGKGEVKVIADFPEPELTALLKLEDGSTLIAAAPTGRIYRLGSDDALSTFTQLGAKFVWDMELDAKGNVWAATGTEGKLFKLSRKGRAVEVEMAHDFSSQNLIDLWIDRDGHMGEKGLIYVAGQNPGWLASFKDGSKEPPRIVYSSGADEIRAIQPVKDGLAIATNTERAPTPQALSLTLRMSGAPAQMGGPGGGGQPSGGQGGGGGEEKAMGDVFAAPKKAQGQPGSAVVLVTREGYARELWNSPEMPIHGLAASSYGNLLVAAGGKGRVFELLPGDAFGLVADTKEDYIVRLIPDDGGWLLAGARNGVVYRMDEEPAKRGEYRSRIVDAGTPVRWGLFYWRGMASKGQKVSIAFRKGNGDDPETGGWEEWTKEKELKAGEGLAIAEPVSRYFQYKVVLEPGREGYAPLKADYFEAFYQQLNRAPRIRQITVGEESAARPSAPSGPPARGGASGGSGEGGVAPSGGGGPRSGNSGSSESGGAAAAVQGGGRSAHSNSGNLSVSWSAEDPNGDTLVYSLSYKADDETQWKVIDDELKSPRLPLGVNGVGDGRYRFRVIASDGLSNPPGEGLTSEFVSEEVVIDNRPPKVEDLKVRASGVHARVTFKAIDDLSLISSIMVDFDGKDPNPIFPKDGLLDQREEEVDWTTPKLDAGEHVITIAVTDRVGNTTVEKAVFETTK